MRYNFLIWVKQQNPNQVCKKCIKSLFSGAHSALKLSQSSLHLQPYSAYDSNEGSGSPIDALSTKYSKWVWSGNTTITNCRQTRGIVRKSRTTITRHQEDKQSKATRSLFSIKAIAKLQWTQSNLHKNIEHLLTSTMGVTINNGSTTKESPP